MDKNLSLRELREKLGLTQQELADRLGMARAYISSVERGASPFSEKFKSKVKNLSFRDSEISFTENHGAMAVDSPGAHVHNVPSSIIEQDKPPAWAKEMEVGMAKLRDQLYDIHALLIKLAAK